MLTIGEKIRAIPKPFRTGDQMYFIVIDKDNHKHYIYGSCFNCVDNKHGLLNDAYENRAYQMFIVNADSFSDDPNELPVDHIGPVTCVGIIECNQFV